MYVKRNDFNVLYNVLYVNAGILYNVLYTCTLDIAWIARFCIITSNSVIDDVVVLVLVVVDGGGARSAACGARVGFPKCLGDGTIAGPVGPWGPLGA